MKKFAHQIVVGDIVTLDSIEYEERALTRLFSFIWSDNSSSGTAFIFAFNEEDARSRLAAQNPHREFSFNESFDTSPGTNFSFTIV